jgi:hypothetical protein
MCFYYQVSVDRRTRLRQRRKRFPVSALGILATPAIAARTAGTGVVAAARIGSSVEVVTGGRAGLRDLTVIYE